MSKCLGHFKESFCSWLEADQLLCRCVCACVCELSRPRRSLLCHFSTMSELGSPAWPYVLVSSPPTSVSPRWFWLHSTPRPSRTQVSDRASSLGPAGPPPLSLLVLCVCLCRGTAMRMLLPSAPSASPPQPPWRWSPGCSPGRCGDKDKGFRFHSVLREKKTHCAPVFFSVCCTESI